MKRLMTIILLCISVNAFAIDGFLQQSTNETIILGPFLDDIDGVTAETTLTITAAEVLLSIDGGGMAGKTEAAACGSGTAGFYTCTLDATDTGTLGILVVHVNEAGAGPVTQSYMIVAANVYVALKSDATAALDTALTDYDPPTNTEMEDRTLAADNYFLFGSDDVAKVTLVTTTTTNSDMITAATVEGECIDALESFKLDELAAEAVTTSLATAVHDNSIIGYMLASANVSAYARTTDSHEDLGENIADIETDTAAFDTDAEYAAAIWGAAMENSKTYAEVMRVFAAVLSGKSSIAGGVMTFVGIDGTTDRLEATVSSGARTSIDTWEGAE